jgi:toxin CptA
MAYYSPKPIHLDLQPSPRLARLLTLACLTAVLALLLWPVGAWLKILFTATAVAATVYAIRLHALLTLQSSIVALRLDQDGKIKLKMRCGKVLEVEVLASSFVSPRLTVLNLRVCGALPPKKNKHIQLLLLPDNSAPDAFRQLRVWLRWGREMEVQ